MKNRCCYLCLLLFCASSFCVAATKNTVLSTFPINKAGRVNPAMTIGLRFRYPVSLPTNYTSSVIIQGSHSGVHAGHLSQSLDKQTLIFTPLKKFTAGELVTATFPSFDEASAPTILSFTISEPLTYSLDQFHSSDPITEYSLHGKAISGKSAGIESFPVLSVVYNQDPAPGNLYLANFRFDPIQRNIYRMILDHQGEVLSAEAAGPRYSLDFRPRDGGGYSYFDATTSKMYMLDSKFTKVDSLTAANGYETDGHDLLYTNTGGYIILAINPVTMDIRPYFEGGYPNASVFDMIIQEFDHNKNLIWEWRSLDHFKVSDCMGISLADSIIDYCHANAIDTDADGNLLLSSRHMDEITKIDRKTGDIHWRWGGINNQFTFIDDTIHFSYQHDIRRTPSGTFTLFDNGDYHLQGGIFSRGIEYRLNEESKTATKVWEYRHSPDVYGMALGSVQRLPNGNTLIGWGACDEVAITEVNPNGDRTFELTMDNQNYSYRVYKYTPEELGVSTGKPRAPSTGIQCFPNPASGQTTISFTAPEASNYSITMWDPLGRCIRTTTGVVQTGNNNLSVDLSGIATGTYYLRTALGSTLLPAEKIIIQ